MSFSGGVYTLPGPALVTGEIVSATENNQFRNDVATAFNLTWLRNGTATATANLPMGGYKLTGLGAATTSGDALSYGNAAVVTTLTSTTLTATRVPYAGTGGLLQDASTFTFDGTTLTAGGFTTSGTVSANTVSASTITASGNITVSGGTANGVAYLNGSKVLTTGSALTFDGSKLGVGTASPGCVVDILAASNTSLSPTLRVNSNNVAVNTALAYDGLIGSGQLTVQAGSASALIFGANASEQMRLTSTGLGIGTSSPSVPLEFAASISTAGSANKIRMYNSGAARYGFGVSSSQLDYVTGGAHVFYIGGNAPSEAMRLDSSGNLGLGVTPSAWNSAFRSLDIGTRSAGFAGSDDATYISTNAYNNAGWKFKGTSTGGYRSALYQQFDGSHQWFNGNTGTAGNAITFTQAMTLDASGNLGIGTTPSQTLDIRGSGANIQVYNTSGSGAGLYMLDTSYSSRIATNTGSLVFYNASYNTERMRIDSSGNVGIGTSSPTANYTLTLGSLARLKMLPATNTLATYVDMESASGQFYMGIDSSTAGVFGQGNYSRVIYSTGAYPLVFTTNGSERMRIDSSGNVGIGTSSPAVKFEVASSSSSVTSRVDSATVAIDCTAASSAGYFGTLTNHPLAFQTNNTERMRIDTSGNLQFNSGYGSVATAYGCRAWVNFDGTAAGTFAGGSSTVTRNVGTTTCTVTTASAHGLITGNVVYNNAITGLVAGARTVTVTNSTTFTFTSTETTSIAAATITFAFANIRASGNVGSVADVGVGNYYINFTTAMPDAYYSVSGSAQHTAGASISIAAAATSASPLTAQSFPFEVNNDAGAALDSATVSIQVFR